VAAGLRYGLVLAYLARETTSRERVRWRCRLEKAAASRRTPRLLPGAYGICTGRIILWR